MKPHISLTPCDAPPTLRCQSGQWWRYEVATESRRNEASGYAPGAEAAARRIAIAALQSLQRMEGTMLTRLGEQTIAVAKRAGHDVGTCNCRLCSNERYKTRMFANTNAKKPRRRATPQSLERVR